MTAQPTTETTFVVAYNAKARQYELHRHGCSAAPTWDDGYFTAEVTAASPLAAAEAFEAANDGCFIPKFHACLRRCGHKIPRRDWSTVDFV